MDQSVRNTLSSEPTASGARLPLDTLCQDCLNVVTHWSPCKFWDTRRLHDLISISATEGCKLCSRILQVCSSTEDVLFSRHDRGKTGGQSRGGSLQIAQDQKPILYLSIKNMSAPDSRLPSEVCGEHIGTGLSWNQALRWLEQCRTQHAVCRENLRAAALTSWMPSRLLDVGNENDDYVKLVLESNDSFMDGLYTTLSHKWGTNDMFKLKKDNISLLIEEGISLSCLPQTFVDAILVTRMLRVPYLWIDSLCIIQDSHQDWAVQSSMMNHVYANSYLNLAASGAAGTASSTAGLLGLRHGSESKRNWHISAQSKVDGTKFLVYDGRLWWGGVEGCALNQRGWVLQERILAPRILYFGRSQLFWECHELEACEMFPDGVPALNLPIFGKSLDQGSFETRLRRRARGLDMRYEVFLTLGSPWCRLVERYSRCCLTQQTDKLVAIAGIAKRMAIGPGDRYLAGIWKCSLPHGLLWAIGNKGSYHEFVREFAPQVDQDSIYLAPSWSWASLPNQTPLYYPLQGTSNRLFQFLHSHVEPAKNHDEFGAIKSASICIRASLFGALRVQGPYLLGNQDGLELTHTIIRPDRRQIEAEIELWFCPLTTVQVFEDGIVNQNKDQLYGLLLVRTDENEGRNEVYRRWGWCEVLQHDNVLFSDTEAGEEARSKYSVTYSPSLEITLI